MRIKQGPEWHILPYHLKRYKVQDSSILVVPTVLLQGQEYSSNCIRGSKRDLETVLPHFRGREMKPRKKGVGWPTHIPSTHPEASCRQFSYPPTTSCTLCLRVSSGPASMFSLQAEQARCAWELIPQKWPSIYQGDNLRSIPQSFLEGPSRTESQFSAQANLHSYIPFISLPPFPCPPPHSFTSLSFGYCRNMLYNQGYAGASRDHTQESIV